MMQAGCRQDGQWLILTSIIAESPVLTAEQGIQDFGELVILLLSNALKCVAHPQMVGR